MTSYKIIRDFDGKETAIGRYADGTEHSFKSIKELDLWREEYRINDIEIKEYIKELKDEQI